MGDFESIISTLTLYFGTTQLSTILKSEKAADSEHEQVNMRDIMVEEVRFCQVNPMPFVL